jgi:hypothetical protein
LPQPSSDAHEHIADLARAIVEQRQRSCADRQIGLTRPYNEVDDRAYSELAELHRDLATAVVAAYGWPAAVGRDSEESDRRLLALNRSIATGEVGYAPFARSAGAVL